MSVKKCKDCGGQVSSSAKQCPHCGKPQHSVSPAKQLAIAAALGVALAVWGTSPDDPAPAPAEREPPTAAERAAQERRDKILAARYACRRAITQSLHDPDSADWSPGYQWPASINGDRVTVQPSLRANNAFGGKVIDSFTCVVDTSGDHLELVSLE